VPELGSSDGVREPEPYSKAPSSSQTGSEWNVLGEAVAGELASERLEPVNSVDHFWFSWAAFRPETRVYESPTS
jgi:hypothetical protein